jgi:(E)-4-hydroxy-3-methylbut-2-enyl-diphosphate synthase
MAVAAYRKLATQIEQPLHLGITEAGGFRSGAVKSAIGLGMLLAEGIGDTIRVSLAADPVEEVKVGFDILKSLHMRSKGINLIACPVLLAPGVRRDRHGERAGAAPRGHQGTARRRRDRLLRQRARRGARGADRAGRRQPNLLYINGKPDHKLGNEHLVDELERVIRAELRRRREQGDTAAGARPVFPIKQTG